MGVELEDRVMSVAAATIDLGNQETGFLKRRGKETHEADTDPPQAT